MNTMSEMTAKLRTANGLKELLRDPSTSDSMREQLYDLLYMKGRIDGLSEASKRISIMEIA